MSHCKGMRGIYYYCTSLSNWEASPTCSVHGWCKLQFLTKEHHQHRRSALTCQVSGLAAGRGVLQEMLLHEVVAAACRHMHRVVHDCVHAQPCTTLLSVFSKQGDCDCFSVLGPSTSRCLAQV